MVPPVWPPHGLKHALRGLRQCQKFRWLWSKECQEPSVLHWQSQILEWLTPVSVIVFGIWWTVPQKGGVLENSVEHSARFSQVHVEQQEAVRGEYLETDEWNDWKSNFILTRTGLSPNPIVAEECIHASVLQPAEIWPSKREYIQDNFNQNLLKQECPGNTVLNTAALLGAVARTSAVNSLIWKMFITTYLNLERCQVPDSREYRFLLEGTLVANPHNLVKIVVSFALVSQRPTSIHKLGNMIGKEEYGLNENWRKRGYLAQFEQRLSHVYIYIHILIYIFGQAKINWIVFILPLVSYGFWGPQSSGM